METLHRLIPKSRPTELGATVEAALAWQDQDLMRLLLESGVNPNEALIGAVRKNDLSMVRFLLNRGADASVSTKADYLSRSVSSGNASVPTYTSPLCQAVAMRQPTLVRLLLESGAVVNPSDAGSNQPLIVAAIAGDVESTRLLLQHGALVNAHDHKDYPDSAPPRALGIPAGTAGSRKPVLTPSTMVIAPGKMAVASSTPAFVPGEPIVVPGRPALVSGATTLASRRPVTPPERTALYYARKYHHSEVAALLEQAGGRTDVP